MTKKELVKSLIININNDLHYYTELNSLLLIQQKLIMQHQAEKLITLNSKIKKQILLLKGNEFLRREIFLGLHFQPCSASINNIAKMLPDVASKKLKSIWLNLEKLAKEGQMINDTNGKLLAIQQETITNLFASDDNSDYVGLVNGT